MRDFLFAPILSLFSIDFYRHILKKPLHLGFLFAAYLSLILTIVTAPRIGKILSTVGETVDWLDQSLPEMTISQDRIKMEIEKPLLLTHPSGAFSIYLDPAKDIPDPVDLEKATCVAARQRVTCEDKGGPGKLIDVFPFQNNKRAFTMTKADLIEGTRMVRNILFFLIPVILFVSIFLQKTVLALCCSGVGLLVNLRRGEKLSYLNLLNLSFFALSPVVLMDALILIFSKNSAGLPAIPSFLITSAFLSWAVLKTVQLPSQPPPPETAD